MNLLKKGAMFGLDARIALAIFGALSVISGAALYSAIQQAKITKISVEMRELEKAFEAVYLDLGYLPNADSTGTAPSIKSNILNKNVESSSYWNGPYYASSYAGNDNSNMVVASNFTAIVSAKLFTGCNSSTSSRSGSFYTDRLFISIDSYDNSTGVCSVDLSLAKLYHDSIDSDGDYTSGKVSLGIDSATSNTAIINVEISSSLLK